MSQPNSSRPAARSSGCVTSRKALPCHSSGVWPERSRKDFIDEQEASFGVNMGNADGRVLEHAEQTALRFSRNAYLGLLALGDLFRKPEQLDRLPPYGL